MNKMKVTVRRGYYSCAPQYLDEFGIFDILNGSIAQRGPRWPNFCPGLKNVPMSYCAVTDSSGFGICPTIKEKKKKVEGVSGNDRFTLSAVNKIF